MTQKAFIIFVDLIIDERLLLDELSTDGGLEALHDLLQDRLVEHQLLTVHHSVHITAGKQLSRLQDHTVGTCVKHVDPQLLVENLTGEDQHLDIRIQFLGMSAYLHADGRRPAKSKIQEHEIGLLLFDHPPVSLFVLCCPDDLGLRDVITNDA